MNEEQKVKKSNPPIAAQVLYALGFVGMLLGLAYCVIIFISASQQSSRSALQLFGYSSFNIQAAVVIAALILIAGFTLLNFIRAGKKWALIAYTTVVALGLSSTLFDFVTASSLERELNGGVTMRYLIVLLFISGLLSVLWTRNRSYFK